MTLEGKNYVILLWLELQKIDGIKTILQVPPSTGLVSFCVNSKSSHHEIVKALGEKSIWIRALEDPIWLRACVHITTTHPELSKLTRALKMLSQ